MTTFIEGQQKMELAFASYQVNIEELEKIKNEYGIKYFVRLEPLFSYIKKNKLSINHNNKLIQSIENNVDLYYYMDINAFIRIINYITSNKEGTNIVRKLKELHKTIEEEKIPKKLLNKDVEVAENLVEVYDIRYKALLLKYITFLIQVLS